MAESMRARRWRAQERSAGSKAGRRGDPTGEDRALPDKAREGGADLSGVPVPIEADSSSGVTGPRTSR